MCHSISGILPCVWHVTQSQVCYLVYDMSLDLKYLTLCMTCNSISGTLPYVWHVTWSQVCYPVYDMSLDLGYVTLCMTCHSISGMLPCVWHVIRSHVCYPVYDTSFDPRYVILCMTCHSISGDIGAMCNMNTPEPIHTNLLKGTSSIQSAKELFLSLSCYSTYLDSTGNGS